jgi:phosphoribosyl 1,2-cyclic phosphodiesterase
MEISVIASGSNGNCCLVESKDTSILIDAGKSLKEINYRMNNLNKDLSAINAILLTHSHTDHLQGIGPIARKHNVPVYTTKEVYSLSKDHLGSVNIKHFSLNSKFKVNNLQIKPVKTSHDVPSCGFVIDKFGLFTDTGIVTDEMKKEASNLNAILLESNHDIDMLLNGKYPAFLKQRILANTGHLNNIQTSEFLQNDTNGLSLALLGHLSENNNKVELVKHTFESIVKKKIDYSVLSREKESGTWKL